MSQSYPPPPPVRACLFDMDGLLLNSEDLYSECTNAVLREHGKPDLPWNIKAKLQGRPGPEAGKIFSDWAQLPISHEEYMAKIAAMQKDLFPSCEPLPGVEKLLRTLGKTENPRTYIALATSSHRRNFELKTQNHAELFKVFSPDVRVLGDDERIPKGRGKPAPDIYLLALKTINDGMKADEAPIKPEECLVFEDSVPGVEAGRRAGMQVVWVPHKGLYNEYRDREKEVLAGLMGEHKEEIAPVVETNGARIPGGPGQIDDGWGRLLMTLEDFPYASYGIKIS